MVATWLRILSCVVTCDAGLPHPPRPPRPPYRPHRPHLPHPPNAPRPPHLPHMPLGSRAAEAMWNSSLAVLDNNRTTILECSDLLHQLNRNNDTILKLEHVCKQGIWQDRHVCFIILVTLGKQPWENSSIDVVCGRYGEELLHAVLHSTSPPVAKQSTSQRLAEDAKQVIAALILVSILALVAGAACICICTGATSLTKSRVGQLAVAPGSSSQGLGAMYTAVPTQVAPEVAQNDLAHQGSSSAGCPNCADLDPAAQDGSVPLLVSDDLKCRDGSVCLAGLPKELAAKLADAEEDVLSRARTRVTLEVGDSPCHDKTLLQVTPWVIAEGKLMGDRSRSGSRYEALL
eukprot:TRINITY_DN65615_c0_g1_i1.p1 TRINITY_DN65615_c0_g1~~TRINITY_DN65615_c0_g1_i1.p1  ORF type:complete len:346 (-),score=34.54 TRINITY_DN65615_c0_g1_i1:67-1104(-)